MKQLSTRKALISSLLSLIVCMSLFLSSTFAWFQDEASANVGKIQAENYYSASSFNDLKTAIESNFKKIFITADIEVDNDITINADVIISGSRKITVKSGATLTNNGTINVDITVESGGVLTDSDTINGSVTGNNS